LFPLGFQNELREGSNEEEEEEDDDQYEANDEARDLDDDQVPSSAQKIVKKSYGKNLTFLTQNMYC
jgi:hypothetical protein